MVTFSYLASPYSHASPEVRQQRFEAACAAAAELMLRGKKVFAPIAYTHPLESHTGPQSHDWWMGQDYPFLIVANELIVLMMDGWEDSKGVAEEIRVCTLLGKPVSYMEPV